MLGETVKKQAKSYAVALESPFYMLTNGNEIFIYERKLQMSDECLFSLTSESLSLEWQNLHQKFGKSNSERVKKRTAKATQ